MSPFIGEAGESRDSEISVCALAVRAALGFFWSEEDALQVCADCTAFGQRKANVTNSA